MDNLDIYNKARAVPDNAKRKITGGRMNGMTDINPVWRIKKLTELFGPCGVGWYYITTRKWLETYGDEIAAFVDIELYIRYDGGEWSKPIQGTGGNMFAKKEKGGIFISDECFKMAVTDAISVACKQLGIGADVYWESDKSKYTGVSDQKDAPQTTYSERLSPVLNELKRTGYSAESVMKLYRVSSLEKMTDLQIKDFLGKIRNVADKKAVVQDEPHGQTS